MPRARLSCGPELGADPVSAPSLELALMFGMAGMPHILMCFTVNE
ncbi:MAG: Cation/acetate symporter ActP [Sodalis sp.]|nr:MAG: Cation/acetate symporter ActP [Sodalis sp.]